MCTAVKKNCISYKDYRNLEIVNYIKIKIK